jgi:hypothetical protein
MRHRRLILTLTGLAVASSCRSRDAADGSGSAAEGDSATTPASTVPWFDGAAPLILVPAHSNDRAIVVAADSLAPDREDGELQEAGSLIRLDGSATPVRISLSSGSEGCVDAALEPAPATAWGVGFAGRAPSGLRVDSMRSISRQDSAALAPTIFQIASTVPNSASGRFAGLPFTLVDLWRMRLPDGAIALIATTKRQINQEDSPLEERTLIVAEADSAGTPFTRMYSSRAAGPEETVEGSELLAAVVFPTSPDLQLVFSHDHGGQISYRILERGARRAWKLRWSSRRFSC